MKNCKYCYNKRYYSVLIGTHGLVDFGGDRYEELPAIKNVACPKCNKGNYRAIPGVIKSIW